MEFKEKLKQLSQKHKELEAIKNELDDMESNDSILTLDATFIKGTPARKKLQTMIKGYVQAEYDAILAEIDESPAKALKYFDYNKLSDTDKATFKAEMKKAKQAARDKIQTELNKLDDISL